MSKWRIAVVAFLISAPFMLVAGYGFYRLWLDGWSYCVGWAMVAAMALAYYLAWRWQKSQKLLRIEFVPELHWTDRDKEAWKLVEARAKTADKIHPDKLMQIDFYSETAQEM